MDAKIRQGLAVLAAAGIGALVWLLLDDAESATVQEQLHAVAGFVALALAVVGLALVATGLVRQTD